MKLIVCPNCRTRVLPKSDGTCPHCHFALEEAEREPVLRIPETDQRVAIEEPVPPESRYKNEGTPSIPYFNFLIWLLILLVIVVFFFLGRDSLRLFGGRFNYATLLGIALGLGGVASLVRSFKSKGWQSVRGIATGIFFIFISVVMVSPSFQSQKQKDRLNLKAEAITSLRIYNANHLNTSLVQIDSHDLLREWADILKTCEYHLPNHPRYEKTYTVELDQRTDKFRYNLDLDANDPETVDLEPVELGTFLFRPAEFTLGTYRCVGLYNFLMKVLPQQSR